MKEKTPITDVKEHVLVCLSSSPSNLKVIKAAAKMAKVFDADFTALFIETPRSQNMSKTDKNRLEENTQSAQNEGAKIVSVNGDDIAFQVSQYAIASKVTKIILGRSGYKPNRFFTPPNFVDKIIELSPDTEIYVIPDKMQKMYLGKDLGQTQIKKNKSDFLQFSWADSLKSLSILALATLVGWVFYKLNIDEANIILVYILGVLLIAYTTTRRIYSLISSIFAVLIFNFFFTEPYFSFNAYGPQYPFTFLTMFLVAFFASSVTKKLKTHSTQASLKAYSTQVMLEMSQKLQQCQSKEDITHTTIEQIKKLLDCKSDLLTIIENNESTKKYPQSSYLHLPITNLEKVFKTIILPKEMASEFQKNLLIAMMRESASAYEKEEISQSKNELMIKNKQEELRSTFLRAISHDLRTPLTGISGFADILMKNSKSLSEDKKQQIYSDIYDDSIWLFNLVENILSITRFDRNEITIKKEPELIQDVITEALSHLGKKKELYNVQTKIEDETIYAQIDGKLIAQVIFNLVDNAIKYSPAGTKIEVCAEKLGSNIEISVSDEGAGINTEDKLKIFDMFYTLNNSITDGRRGLGLGLALCKSIINAHGGEISIKDNHPKGTVFSFQIECGEIYE